MTNITPPQGASALSASTPDTASLDQELRESEARFRGTFENAAVGIAHVGIDGTWLRVNQRLCGIVGYTWEELRHKTFQDITHPDDLTADLDQFGPLMRGEIDSYSMEKRYFHKRGDIVWIYLTTALQHDETGIPEYCISIIQDITERKRAEQALSDAERQQAELLALLESLLANAPIGFAFFDRDHRYVRINETLADINGLPVEAHLERPISEVLPINACTVDPIIDQVFTTGMAAQNLEVTGETPAAPGVTRHWLTNFYPVLEAGITIYVGAVVVEITDRKYAEEALRNSEARFRQLTESLPQLVWSCTPDGQCDYLSRQWIEYTGVPEEESFGAGWLESVHPDDRQSTIIAWQVAVASGEDFHTEFRIRSAKGVYRWFKTRAVAIRDDTGTIVKWFGSNTDIDDLKRAEVELRAAKEAAEAANQMKSTFLATMSHEIRTPLTSMIGFAALLAQKLEGRQRTQAQRIEQGGERLLETLNAVLMLAKLEADRVHFHLDAIPVTAEVQAIVQLQQAQAIAKGLVLMLDITPEATTAQAHLDRGAFTSIVQNLVSNAIKYTEQGSVMVTVAVNDIAPATKVSGADISLAGWVHIHVEDTGIGIAPSSLPYLFDAFYRENEDVSRSYEGAGLGLAIVRQLVEKMNGTIGVESEPGRGSRFTVSFPHASVEIIDQLAGLEQPATTFVQSSLHLLLVEDNVDIQTLAAELLAEQCCLTIATNAQEALTAAQQAYDTGHPFDGAILDINLGGGPSGTDLLNALRSLPSYQTVPMAAMTAYALPGDREKFLRNGFDAYLQKPFTPQALRTLVARLWCHHVTDSDLLERHTS